MPFFYNYNNAGKGVPKKEVKKKSFFRFWDLFVAKFWKLILLNMLYILFCIPIVTFGPATAALTKVLRSFYLEQPVFLFDEFWTAFKKNFRQSLVVGLIDVVVIVAFVFSSSYFEKMLAVEFSASTIAVMAVSVAATVFFFMINFYLYLEIVALDLPFFAMVKNAIMFVFIGIKNNIVSLLSCVLVSTLIYLFSPYSFLLLPVIPFGQLALLIVFNSYPIIQKHVIIPFYENNGLKNPEIKDTDKTEETVFTDLGGKEEAVKIRKSKNNGKLIR